MWCMHLQIQPMTTRFSLLFTPPENASSETKTSLLSLKHCLCSLAFLCVCLHMHSHTCISLFPSRTSWLSSKSYLLDTVPGISLLIVQLCRSGMATEPRHCTQKYPSWNRMRHRFWCGTETNITSKVNALLNTTHYEDGTCFATKQQMSSLLTTSFCKPQHVKFVCLHASKYYIYAHRKEHAVHLFICHARRPLQIFYHPSLLLSEKRNEEWQKYFVMISEIYCSKGREICNFTEWHSLEKDFKAINRFLVPLAWDSGEKWSFVAVGHEQVHLRRRSSLVGSCVETTMKPHAVFAYLDGQ